MVRGELRTHARRIPVAVKSLPGLTDDVTRARLDRELKAHITAQHVSSGVCRLLGTCDKDRTLCLVMKLYDGSLRDRMTTGLDTGEARRIAHALSRTLGQLHDTGVVVRDIKPENVLMDEFGEPVLADFGISDVVTRTTRIMPTSMQGTFNYMAPESFEEIGIGPEVDVWAMGCLIFEMCTGVMPFAGMRIPQITRAVCDRRVVPDVPDHAPAADVVRRCFAFEPAARPSAAELATALAPENAELPEVVGGMADAFARKVATLTTQLATSDAARVAAEAERDRAVAAQATVEAERDRVVVERDRERADCAARAAEIQRLRAQMAAASVAAPELVRE